MAKRLFAAQLVPRADTFQNGFDFNVEIPADEGHPSRRFLVQVKTSSTFPARADGLWVKSLNARDVAAFKASRHPVLLFMVDLRSEAVRFLDVQRYLRENLGRQVKARKEDEWIGTSTERLLTTVEAAELELDATHRSPAELLDHRRRALERSDPRFNILASCDGVSERYELHAKETVEFTLDMRVETPADQEALADTMRYGTPSTIHPAEVAVCGSALLEQVAAKSKTLTIVAEASHELFCFAAADSNGESMANTAAVYVPGTTTRGFSGLELLSSECHALMRFRLRWDQTTGTPSFTLLPALGAWHGTQMRRLPNVGALADLLSAIAGGGGLKLSRLTESQYQPLIWGVPNFSAQSELRSFARFFGGLRHLVFLCDHFGWDAAWDADGTFTRDEVETWRTLSRIIRAGAAEITFGEVGVEQTSSDQSLLRAVIEQKGSLHLISRTEIKYCGRPVGLAYVRLDINDYVVETDGAGRISKIKAGPSGRATGRVFADESVAVAARRTAGPQAVGKVLGSI